MAEISTTTNTPVVLESRGMPGVKEPVTVTGADLVAGTVLGRITASGKYKAYSNGNSDGSEVARGVLAYAAKPTTEGRDVQAAMYTEGRFVEANLTGLDANAKADLNGSSSPSGEFTFRV